MGAAASRSTPSCAAVLRELHFQHRAHARGRMGALSISKPQYLVKIFPLFNYIFSLKRENGLWKNTFFIANSDVWVRGGDYSKRQDMASHSCSHVCPNQQQPCGPEHQTLRHPPPDCHSAPALRHFLLVHQLTVTPKK